MSRLTRKLKSALGIKRVENASSADVPLFGSYQDALDACGDKGYQARDLVDVVVEKNLVCRAQISSSGSLGLDSLRTMIGIGALQPSSTLRVLDFGGGGGYHYLIARAVLGEAREIRWNVVETPAMAKVAREKLAGGGLDFFEDIRDAAADLGQVDLVFTSGALQYTPDPHSFLKELLAIKSSHFFITRTPMSDGADRLISVQSSMLSGNGPGPLPPGFNDYKIKYPITFLSRQDIVKTLTEAYKIRFSVDEGRFSHSVAGRSFNMYGYFLDIKD